MNTLKLPSQYFLATSLMAVLTGVTCVHEAGVRFQSVFVRRWASWCEVLRELCQVRSFSLVPPGVWWGCIVLNILVDEYVVRLCSVCFAGVEKGCGCPVLRSFVRMYSVSVHCVRHLGTSLRCVGECIGGVGTFSPSAGPPRSILIALSTWLVAKRR